MALDTQDKRSSAMHLGSPWRGMLPIPDGTLGQGDRQHIMFLYQGILAEAEEVVVAHFPYQFSSRGGAFDFASKPSRMDFKAQGGS